MPTEPQQTSMDNQYFDVASVLYHTLRGSQTLASYIEDARQGVTRNWYNSSSRLNSSRIAVRNRPSSGLQSWPSRAAQALGEALPYRKLVANGLLRHSR
jgi:hypothetical protein